MTAPESAGPPEMLRVRLQLAYCAWLLLAPASIARYEAPVLPPWFQLFVDVVREAPEVRDDDRPGQHYRRAIIAGATPEAPFPGELRGKALLLEGLVRRMSVERLRTIGGPASVCTLLGCAVKARRPAAWRRDLAIATRAESAA